MFEHRSTQVIMNRFPIQIYITLTALLNVFIPSTVPLQLSIPAWIISVLSGNLSDPFLFVTKKKLDILYTCTG